MRPKTIKPTGVKLNFDRPPQRFNQIKCSILFADISDNLPVSFLHLERRLYIFEHGKALSADHGESKRTNARESCSRKMQCPTNC